MAILEDVITTGASTLRAVSRAREFGFEVVHALALVDRQEDGGAALVRAEVPLTTVFVREDFR